jgi:crotonobetainyl-CoA:carnitine CoA-transferase CaiB-like acyl-CoA transferase
MKNTSRPLDGVRVLDLSHMAAGPFCSMMLADMGADVIKIEIPGKGDGLRSWGPPFLGKEGVYFLYLNRNKKSMTLNLKSPKGRRVLIQLMQRADVLLENFVPGTMEKLGLGPQDIMNLNPRLVYCRISGYGQTGPYSNRPGYDLLVQAQGGLMTITGEPDHPPGAKVGVAIADLGTGMYAAYGIVLSLLAREKTGKGQVTDVALFDSVISWMLQPIGSYLVTREMPERLGTVHPVAAPYQAFRTKDSYVVIGCAVDEHWQKLCDVLEIDELAKHARFATNPKRVENRKELESILKEIFVREESDVWLRRMQEAGIPCAPVNTLERVVMDPQVLQRRMLVEVDHPTAGRIQVPGIPVKLSDTPAKITDPPPLLGEHTSEVLQELGYSPDQIGELRKEGII